MRTLHLVGIATVDQHGGLLLRQQLGCILPYPIGRTSMFFVVEQNAIFPPAFFADSIISDNQAV